MELATETQAGEDAPPQIFEIGSVKFLKPFALIGRDYHAYNFPKDSITAIGIPGAILEKKIAVGLVDRAICEAIPIERKAGNG